MNIGIDLSPLEKPLTKFAENQAAAIEMQKPIVEGLSKTFDKFGSSIDRFVDFGLKQEERRSKLRDARDEMEILEMEVKKAELKARIAAMKAAGEQSLAEAAKARSEAEILEAKNELKKQELEAKKLANKEEEEQARHKAKLEKLEKGELGYCD